MSGRMIVVVLGALLAGGCLSKTELPPPRYFRPGPLLPPDAGAAAAPAERAPLRLREVTAADHLRERMVWATPAQEYGFYEQARWTEAPAAFVDAALGRALFEQGPFRRAAGADAPVLDVHVAAFEEVIDPDRAEGRHDARVALRVLLTGPEGQALVERTFVGAAPVTGSEPGPEDAAAAIGRAMDQAVTALAQAVAEATR
jgi:ABC-type uncharacterized transport system auxiliary subunit